MKSPPLTPAQVSQFGQEGYLLYKQPVLPQEKFTGLKTYFEGLLDTLPDSIRPEAMDVPHFAHPQLFTWLFAPEILDIVESLIGPDIAFFASHFICKPKGNGKRVPWHEDSAYWKGMVSPMEVVTLWLAIDPSTTANGCMYVIPRTHQGPKKGFSDYDQVDTEKNVFNSEITPAQRNDKLAVPCILDPNQASLHDGRLMHSSPPNTSNIRRCGYTMRYFPTTVRFNHEEHGKWHQIYLARGRDHAGNQYADPGKSYPDLARYREASGKKGH